MQSRKNALQGWEPQPLTPEELAAESAQPLSVGQVSFHLDAHHYRRVPLSGAPYTNHWLTLCTNRYPAAFWMDVFTAGGVFVGQRTAYYQAEWWQGANNHYVVIHAGDASRDCTVFWSVS